MIICGRKVSPWKLALVAAALVGLSACGAASGTSGSSAVPGSAASAAHNVGSKATQSAVPATDWLKANGYAKLPIPGFGHMAFGIRNNDPKYAGVYDTSGKDDNLVAVIVQDAQQKLASDHTTGVTITFVKTQGVNAIVVTAVNKADVKAAAKALLAAAKHPGGGA